MSKRHNGDSLFIDTGWLRDHISKLREQKKLASRLYDNVLAMKHAGDPTEAYRYDPILRDIELLIEYFGRMATVLSRTDDEAVKLSAELGDLIQTGTEQTKHTIEQNFSL